MVIDNRTVSIHTSHSIPSIPQSVPNVSISALPALHLNAAPEYPLATHPAHTLSAVAQNEMPSSTGGSVDQTLMSEGTPSEIRPPTQSSTSPVRIVPRVISVQAVSERSIPVEEAILDVADTTVLQAPSPSASRFSILNGLAKPVMSIVLIGDSDTAKAAFLRLIQSATSSETAQGNANDLGAKAGASSNLYAISSDPTVECNLHIFTTQDGKLIRVLDTPASNSDAPHNQSVIQRTLEAIQSHFDSVDALLVFGTGGSDRLSQATEDTLVAISGLFPTSLVDIIGFVSTNHENSTGLDDTRRTILRRLASRDDNRRQAPNL
jgi:hypothetical protein